ncbi:hypothetical protein CDAR_407461 [Caerostris darwini]|uniref:Secreted protein n=1 Tax=Caerostris darwini TaxID=1538125 RepID=A0AAV4Q0W1_9ARAC|nr:hypothetical protein CDAR_407461 [Caerostris darwini]
MWIVWSGLLSWNQFLTIGSGSPRVTTSSDDRYLRLSTRRNSTETESHFRSALASATGTVSSKPRQYAQGRVLKTRMPVLRVRLTSGHGWVRF